MENYTQIAHTVQGYHPSVGQQTTAQCQQHHQAQILKQYTIQLLLAAYLVIHRELVTVLLNCVCVFVHVCVCVCLCMCVMCVHVCVCKCGVSVSRCECMRVCVW